MICVQDQMQCFLVVKVNCSLSVFNYSQTHLNIAEDQSNEQIVVKVSESVHAKILYFASDDVMAEKQPKRSCLLTV